MDIAHVALPVPLATLFDYLIPDHLRNRIANGVRVRVSFGPRKAIGIVVAIGSASTLQPALLKNIEAVIDETPLFSPKLWKLTTWAASYYHHPIGEVLFHALPGLLRQGKPANSQNKKRWQLTDEGKKTDPGTLTRSPKQQKLLQLLQGNTPEGASLKTPSFTPSVYQKLAKHGLIKQQAVPNLPGSSSPCHPLLPSHFVLNAQQLSAINRIINALSEFNVWLVDGVTGSGKTEIYLSTLEKIIARGQQALVLVPEISLTPQTVNRFKARFSIKIDVLHSKLTDRERLTVYLRAKQGENTLVIGTRSALFTPFKHLGLIVIDEEHDGSYKQQEGFRYHARDLAVVRAQFENIPIILGSATPSLESLYNTQKGKYHHLKLTKRAGNASFASQHIIDIKGLTLTAGLSTPLIKRIGQHLAKNQQVLLFLNRRGYAPRLICHDCSWLAGCQRCDKPYTYHQTPRKLSCHHCSSVRSIPLQCHQCGGTHLKTLGLGTEQVAEQLTILFRGVPVYRIDRDSTQNKDTPSSYLTTMNQEQAHILVGTQILTKGHHLPNVTLVGIIDIDSALFSSDFRATERFAQIYTQVAGRAGRESKPGEVIMQTYYPDHPLLNLLLSQSYSGFAAKTLQERQATDLPPFSYHVLLRATDKNNRHAPAFLLQVYQWLKNHHLNANLWLQKPMPAILQKKAGNYRWQLLIQHPQRHFLRQLINELNKQIGSWPEAKSVRWTIDVDPIEA